MDALWKEEEEKTNKQTNKRTNKPTNKLFCYFQGGLFKYYINNNRQVQRHCVSFFCLFFVFVFVFLRRLGLGSGEIVGWWVYEAEPLTFLILFCFVSFFVCLFVFCDKIMIDAIESINVLVMGTTRLLKTCEICYVYCKFSPGLRVRLLKFWKIMF